MDDVPVHAPDADDAIDNHDVFTMEAALDFAEKVRSQNDVTDVSVHSDGTTTVEISITGKDGVVRHFSLPLKV